MDMKKNLFLFLSIFAWLWITAACSNDSEQPLIEPNEPVKYFNMHEKDSLALMTSLYSLLLEPVELNKFMDSEWEYIGSDGYKYHQYYYQGIVFNTLWDTEENIYRLWRVAIDSPELLPSGYSLSPALGNLERLTKLEIKGDERATSEIPKEIFNCPLIRLHISGKGFTGVIPKEIANVANTLCELEITGTSISILPEEIGTVQKVIAPNLSYNEFRGTPPLSLRNFLNSAWCFLNFFDNMDWRMFTEFPGYGVDPVIRSIPLLHDNCLSGEIPKEVLDSKNWFIYKDCLGKQQAGYEFNNWP